jgi:hypothetical protein
LAGKPTKAKSSKKPSTKAVSGDIGRNEAWVIKFGELKRSRGRPTGNPLFKVVGEKIPFVFLKPVKRQLESQKLSTTGVYIAHDSMGYPRYIGRGNVFGRLGGRKKAQELELQYFSFFIVEDKTHEREIETIMIRAAGPLLDFNDRKVRADISPGDIRDFEPGTRFVQRQYRKGRKASKNKKG